MACICYNGPDIVELDIQQGDRLNDILVKLVTASVYPGCATFSDPTLCQSALNVTFTNITSTSFEISWDQVPAATAYAIEFKLTTDLTWTSTVPIIPPTGDATIIGLAADTIYDVRVVTTCTADVCYSLNYRIKTLES
jgi:hypothetical protein